MIETKRFHCSECGNFWEITTNTANSNICPVCNGTKVYRTTGDRRYSRKSRAKVRRSYSPAARR